MRRIAIDARELEGKPTGVGRYLSAMLSCWLAGQGAEIFTLYHARPLPAYAWLGSERVKTRLLGRGLMPLGLWWQQVVLARALKREPPDLLFAPADSMPLRWSGPTVLTFLDLSYEAFPQWFGLTEGWRRRALARRSARRATALTAISRFTRDELVARYRLAPDKVSVIHLGVDETLHRAPFAPAGELRQRLELGHSKAALFVGSLFERRFPLRVIGALAHLRDLDIRLVIAGDDRRRSRSPGIDEFIDRMDLRDRVRWLRYCTERDLCGLYRLADLIIAPSLYEGFSLPPLEAMGFGVPAVVSARGAQLEVYGGSAITLEDETEENIAAAVRRILSDRELRTDLQAKGRDLAGRMTMRRCAEQTLNLMRVHAAAES